MEGQQAAAWGMARGTGGVVRQYAMLPHLLSVTAYGRTGGQNGSVTSVCLSSARASVKEGRLDCGTVPTVVALPFGSLW